MADILIRGVEMPNSCEKCPFCDYEQGFCFAVWKFIDGGWPEFSLNVGGIKTRHPKCPLVRLPEGHGELKDSNSIITNIKQRFCKGCLCLPTSFNCQFCKITITKALSIVYDAPTIVPAEGGADYD